MKLTPRYWIVRYIALLIVILISYNGVAQGQQINQWTPQEKIPRYKIDTEIPPLLIADQNRVLHVFNSQPLDLEQEGSPEGIFYRQWTIDGGWTPPIDILVDPGGGNLELLGVTLDQANNVHMAVQIDSEAVYYTQAPLINASRVTAWSPLQLVGSQLYSVRQGINSTAAIANDGKGKLVLIYSGLQVGNGLYAIYSQDNGLSWSDPSPLYLTKDPELVVVEPRLYYGESGLLHAVWSTFKADGFGGPGYYAQFDFERLQWSEPLELDVPGIRTTSVIEYAGDVFVSYYHHNVNGNWWRRSFDDGRTWTRPVRFSEIHIGTNGAVSFAVDSSNVLHAFFGGRIDEFNHGLWHLVWTGDGWSVPESVVREPQVRDEVGGNGFDPRSPNAIVSNGNLLFVSWGTDGAAGTNGAWYSYTFLDSPELPLMTLPSPMTTPDNSTNPVPVIEATNPLTPTTTPILTDFASDQLSTAVNNPAQPMIIGLIPSLLLISLVLIARIIIRKDRN